MSKPQATKDSGLRQTSPVSGNVERWVVLGFLALGLIGLLYFFDVRGLLRETLAQVARLGAWAPLIFVLVYVLAAVLFVPGSALTLGAGALFGVVRGSIYVSIASTLAAGVAFLLGRYVARDWVAKKIQGNATFDSIDRALADEGWKIVLLTRLSPVFPFTLLNYAFGLTRVGFREYILWSWIGMMPGTVLYVYLGSLVNLGAGAQQRTPAQWTAYGLGLAATVAVTVVITRIAKRALANKTRSK